MTEVTIVYWRDIPAQVIVGRGRRGDKRALPARFEQAIDRAAMKAGAAGSDAYLDEWRKAPLQVDAPATDAAAAAAALIDRTYDAARLRRLIENAGHAPRPVSAV
ncbi:virulence factor [Tranquillimonas rosea]|uniref:virulence factor n=1 Tax=Tranquillimonas rosea TaxID=641238 RepID=UPI003BABB287